MLNTSENIIKHKTGLLNLAEELGNVSKACQVMGMSRDTFYRYKSAVEDICVEEPASLQRQKNGILPRKQKPSYEFIADRCCTLHERLSVVRVFRKA